MAASSSIGLQGLGCEVLSSSRSCRLAAPCIHSVRTLPIPRWKMQLHRPQHAALAQQQQLQQQHSLASRRGIIAAAGRRRKSAPSPDPEEQPDLDLDDVMYDEGPPEGGEGDEGDEGLALEDDEPEAPEAPDFEDEEEYELGDEEEEEFEEAEGEEGEEPEEGWDAALSNFDAAQDASAGAPQAPQGPSKEEAERAAALAMVRWDEFGDHDSEEGSGIEVLEVPAPQEVRPKSFEEQAAALAPADREALTRNRQGYASFPMDDMDLLVNELPDGRMVLADAFVLDRFEELFARPAVSDDIPTEPRMYQLMPWEHVHTGDELKRIEPKVTLMRMYFVGVKNSSRLDWEVDMSQVYSFDCVGRRMVKHEVVTLGEDIVDPILRIREDGVFIEDSARVPSMVLLAEGFVGHPQEQYTHPDKEFNIRDYVRMGLWPEPGLVGPAGAGGAAAGDEAAAAAELDQELLEERLEELELMEELDDMPDVPAVDMV